MLLPRDLPWERAYDREDANAPQIAKLRLTLPADYPAGTVLKLPMPCACSEHTSRFTKIKAGTSVVIKWDLGICGLAAPPGADGAAAGGAEVAEATEAARPVLWPSFCICSYSPKHSAQTVPRQSGPLLRRDGPSPLAMEGIARSSDGARRDRTADVHPSNISVDSRIGERKNSIRRCGNWRTKLDTGSGGCISIAARARPILHLPRQCLQECL